MDTSTWVPAFSFVAAPALAGCLSAWDLAVFDVHTLCSLPKMFRVKFSGLGSSRQVKFPCMRKCARIP